MSLFKPAVSEILINTVVTVGTPYFRSGVPRLTRLGQIGSVLTIPGALFLAYALIDYFVNPPFGPGVPTLEQFDWLTLQDVDQIA